MHPANFEPKPFNTQTTPSDVSLSTNGHNCNPNFFFVRLKNMGKMHPADFEPKPGGKVAVCNRHTIITTIIIITTTTTTTITIITTTTTTTILLLLLLLLLLA